MLMKDARDQIVEYGKEMLRSGLTRGTSGNLSVYDPATGYMAISPSGIGYFETKPEDIVIMTLDGSIVEGKRKPSSEAGMHAGFYRKKPGTHGIVHTHSVFATTFACLLRPIDMIHFCICDIGELTGRGLSSRRQYRICGRTSVAGRMYRQAEHHER